MGWGFLYAAEEMKNQTKDIPGWVFKIFVEKYYLRILDILKIFDEHDLDIIKVYMEEIKNIMMN